MRRVPLTPPTGNLMTECVRWTVLTALAATVFSACTDSKAPVKSLSAAPTDTVSKVLTKGIPDVAAFFAATKTTGQCPNDTTCVYLQTFLNGATREITLVVSPNRKSAPGSRAIAGGEFGNAPISGFRIVSNFDTEPATVNLNYYVGRAGLPAVARKTAMLFSPRSRNGLRNATLQLASEKSRSDAINSRLRFAAMVQEGEGEGAGISWGEIGKKGADTGIGALMDAAKEEGIPLSGKVGSIYALASALSAVSEANELGKQNTRWLKELDALEKCAGDPSNPVSRTDPNYSSRTVAKIEAARSELKEVNSVRFLNQMTEKGADLNPVTAVLAVGLKQGFLWSDETLGDYSENTIMREARLAVVKCEDPGNASGNLDYKTTCNLGPNDVTVTHIVANVSWEWQVGVKYNPKGDYKYEAIRTIGAKCTEKSTGQGSLEGTGYLFIFDDPARQKELGYGYEARFVNWPTKVTKTTNCGINAQYQSDIDFVPVMHGFRGTGGTLEGTVTGNACSPGTLKWSFSVAKGK